MILDAINHEGGRERERERDRERDRERAREGRTLYVHFRTYILNN